MSEPHEFKDETVLEAIDFVTSQTAVKFRDFTSADDVRQELAVYAYGEGRKHIAKWYAADEKHRVYLALFGVANQYGETQKAAASGYEFQDLAWYAPDKLRDWLPFALDPAWDGLSGERDGGGRQSSGREGGTLLAMVADLRSALRACPAAAHAVTPPCDDHSEEYHGGLVALADWLGGEYPSAPGYQRVFRRAMSNEAALLLTRRQVAA